MTEKNETSVSDPQTCLLDVRNLSIEADIGGRWTVVVDNIHFTLTGGEVLGLIGESGAGKSTIGLATLGYARPGCRIASGEILFHGQDLLAMSEKALRDIRGMRISYVAQSAASFFNPAHTLLTQFIEVLATHNVRDRRLATEKAISLYRRLGLPEPEMFGNRYPHQVSGGQLQRAMIAMAMAGDPEVIVFDEPTTALDVTTQVGVLKSVRDAVAGTDTAALYITHDLAVVAQLADRIMVLRHGKMVETGATTQLLKSPLQEYTRQLLAADPQGQPGGQDTGCLLAVQGVSAHYGPKRVLDDISIEVPKGATVAVVGESGSGKSTLARTITGLLMPTQGSIFFEGERLAEKFSDRDRTTLRRIQMVYQTPDTALNPRHTVLQTLVRPLAFYHGITGEAATAKVIDLLEQVELNRGLMWRHSGDLSGGQKQRVCIARALAAKPDLIICDEITSGLDPLVAKDILELLHRIQSKFSVAYLFITHDLKVVQAIADHVVVMQNGKIVEQGDRDAIMNAPRSDYTKALIRAVPQVDVDWLDGLLLADARLFVR